MVLHDPVRHRFFRLPASTYENFSALSGQNHKDKNEDMAALSAFLEQNRLTASRPGLWSELAVEHARSKRSFWTSALHNYVSFRIPLFCPERFLDATLPVARGLVSPAILLVLAVMTVTGLYFTSRQWDQFVGMFWTQFTLAGAITFAAALVVLKVFHELGHAYVARAFGCRVPSIGVAFMMMAPMLYTDATDAWRIPSRRRRCLIGAAGILVEMAIASVALFFWALLPDGGLRAVMFFLAATAWISSVIVNLSPFMRFDGYHILADALGMHSLGPRSLALGRWRLREMLFKPDLQPPEFFPVATRRALIGFAVATCLYRLSLFLGIAWLLYTSLPKAAGLPLALVEIHFFIVSPILQELKVWKTMGLQRLLRTRRTMLSGGFFVALVVLAALPLDRHVQVPAVLLAGAEARLFPPEPARVLVVHARPGDTVRQGQVLAQLFVPDISHWQKAALLRQQIATAKLRRAAADTRNRAELKVLEQEQQTAAAELEGLGRRGRALVLRAPIAGRLTGDGPVLREQQWVGWQDLLFVIVDDHAARLVGLVQERDSARLAVGAAVSFVAADGLSSTKAGQLVDIGLAGAEGRALPYLSGTFGGPVVVHDARSSQSIAGYLPLVMALDSTNPVRSTPGTAVIAAESQSVLGFLARRLATVFLRESGF